MKVMTYNIRVDCVSDWIKNHNWWLGRGKKVTNIIKNEDPDIIGVQEIKHQFQLLYLKIKLKGYKSVFYGNLTNKGIIGEGLAIFYKRDKFKLINSNFKYLSETPYKQSKGLDAKYRMICVWALLNNKSTNENIPIMVAHPDPSGEISRKISANILIETTKDFKDICIIMGDMNFCDGTEPYKEITKYYNDSYYETSNKEQIATYNGWKMDIPNESGFRGDMILTNRKIKNYKVIKDISSDHFPLIVEID